LVEQKNSEIEKLNNKILSIKTLAQNQENLE